MIEMVELNQFLCNLWPSAINKREIHIRFWWRNRSFMERIWIIFFCLCVLILPFMAFEKHHSAVRFEFMIFETSIFRMGRAGTDGRRPIIIKLKNKEKKAYILFKAKNPKNNKKGNEFQWLMISQKCNVRRQKQRRCNWGKWLMKKMLN